MKKRQGLFFNFLIPNDDEEEARLSQLRRNHCASNNSVLFFHFLLLPNKDGEEEEAMLSLYPTTTKTSCIISRGKTDDSVPFLIFYCYPLSVIGSATNDSLPFYFLLLPVDNKDDIEVRLSLYPALRFAHLTV